MRDLLVVQLDCDRCSPIAGWWCSEDDLAVVSLRHVRAFDRVDESLKSVTPLGEAFDFA